MTVLFLHWEGEFVGELLTVLIRPGYTDLFSNLKQNNKFLILKGIMSSGFEKKNIFKSLYYGNKMGLILRKKSRLHL